MPLELATQNYKDIGGLLESPAQAQFARHVPADQDVWDFDVFVLRSGFLDQTRQPKLHQIRRHARLAAEEEERRPEQACHALAKVARKTAYLTREELGFGNQLPASSFAPMELVHATFFDGKEGTQDTCRRTGIDWLAPSLERRACLACNRGLEAI